MNFSITGIDIVNRKNNFSIDDIPGSIKTAFRDSDTKIDNKNCRTVGIFIGTTFHNSDTRRDNTDNYRKGGVRIVNPADFPRCLISYLGGHLSGTFNLKGANSTMSSGISSGFDALIQAAYFVEQTKRNKALVVELEEKVSEDLKCVLGGSACLVIENKAGTAKKDNNIYGDILAIESFFEREGKNSSLAKAIGKVLEKSRLNLRDIDYIFIPEKPKTAPYSPEENTLKEFSNLSNIEPPYRLFKIAGHNKGLFMIANILKNMDFAAYPEKKPIISLFLSLGKDSNSSSAVIKIYRGGR